MAKFELKLRKRNLKCLCKSKKKFMCCLCGKTNKHGQGIHCSCQSFTKSTATKLPYDECIDNEYKESCIEKLCRKCGMKKRNNKKNRAPNNVEIRYDQRLYRIGCNVETDCYTKDYRNYDPNEIEEEEIKVKKKNIKKQKAKKVIGHYSYRTDTLFTNLVTC